MEKNKRKSVIISICLVFVLIVGLVLTIILLNNNNGTNSSYNIDSSIEESSEIASSELLGSSEEPSTSVNHYESLETFSEYVCALISEDESFLSNTKNPNLRIFRDEYLDANSLGDYYWATLVFPPNSGDIQDFYNASVNEKFSPLYEELNSSSPQSNPNFSIIETLTINDYSVSLYFYLEFINYQIDIVCY